MSAGWKMEEQCVIIVRHYFLRKILKKEPNPIFYSEKTEAFSTHLRDYVPYIVWLFRVRANCLS